MQIDCRLSKLWRIVALAGVVGLAASWSTAGPGRPKAASVQPAPKVVPPAPVAPPVKDPAAPAKILATKNGKNEPKHTSGRPDQPTGLRGIGNDECTGAVNLGNVNPTGMAFDNATATTGTDGQANAACLFFGTMGIDRDEWFRWTSPLTGSALLQACGAVVGGTDTKIAVYSGATCPPGVPIGCNDDSCGLTSQVAFLVTLGQEYLFQIGDYPGTVGLSGTFTITATAGGGGPANDECGGAIAVTGNPATQPFDTSFATTSACCQANAICNFYGLTGIEHDLWYTWQSPVTGSATITNCGNTMDSKVAIFSGATCPPVTAPVGCNDDSCGLQSVVNFGATAGTTYLIQFGTYPGAAGAAGSFTISAQAGFPCESAVLIAAGANAVDNTGVAGSANPSFSCTGAGVGPKWYKFVATATSAVVQTCNSVGPAADSTMAVYAGPCGAGLTELGCNDDACGFGNGWFSKITVEGLAIGSTYFIQFCTYGTADQGAYTLEITMPAPPPCTVSPAAGTPEGEPVGCGIPSDNFNGGCNSVPPIFSPIACGQTILGTVGNNGGTRDTDWYQIVLTGATNVTWSVSTQFSGLAGIVDNNGGIPNCATIPGTFRPGYVITAGDCTPGVVTDALTAGTWWFFVATSGFSGTACGSMYGNYSATLAFVGGCPVVGPDCFTRGAAGALGAGCLVPILTHARPQANGHYARGGPDGSADALQCMGDWDGDGCVTPADVAAFIVAWFYSANNAGNLDGDIDCSSVADPVDVAIFVQRWFAGLNTPAAEGCV